MPSCQVHQHTAAPVLRGTTDSDSQSHGPDTPFSYCCLMQQLGSRDSSERWALVQVEEGALLDTAAHRGIHTMVSTAQ
jgi:hypothetical protein